MKKIRFPSRFSVCEEEKENIRKASRKQAIFFCKQAV